MHTLCASFLSPNVLQLLEMPSFPALLLVGGLRLSRFSAVFLQHAFLRIPLIPNPGSAAIRTLNSTTGAEGARFVGRY